MYLLLYFSPIYVFLQEKHHVLTYILLLFKIVLKPN